MTRAGAARADDGRVHALVLSLALLVGSDDERWLGWPLPSQRLADPPPIVPSEWLVARAGGLDAAAIVARHLVDGAQAPEAGDAWEVRGDVAHLVDVVAAYAQVESPVAEVRMAKLTGGDVLVVNGEPFPGDPERRGLEGVPVALRAGTNELYVFGAPQGFVLELWKPRGRLVVGNWDADWPPPEIEDSLFDIERVPIYNASLERVEGLHFHYGDPVADPQALAFDWNEWSDGASILPLCSIGGRAWNAFDGLPEGAREVFVPIEVSAGEDEDDVTRTYLRGPVGEGRGEIVPAGAGPPSGATLGLLGKLLTARLGPDIEARLEDRPKGSHWAIPELALISVYATGGGAEERSLALARFDAERLRSHTRLMPTLLRDTDAAQDLAKEQSWIRQRVVVVLLYGTARTNAAWSAIGSTAGTDRAESDARAGWIWDEEDPEVDAPHVLRFEHGGADGFAAALALRMAALDFGATRLAATLEATGLRVH